MSPGAPNRADGTEGPLSGSVAVSVRSSVVAAFAILVFASLIYHEPWRDEMGSWIRSSLSSSAIDLVESLDNGGHAWLWNLCLYGISRWTEDPLGFRIFHAIVATSTMAVIGFTAPLSTFAFALFAIGYFPSFEYAAISRCYALGFFFVVAACALHVARPGRILTVASILALAAQTSVYGTFVTLALALAIGVDVVTHGFTSGRARAVAGAGIVALGVAAAIYQLIPSPDSGFATAWRFSFDLRDLRRSLGTVWGALVPIPAPGLRFWNTNFVDGSGWKPILGAGLLIGSTALFSDRRESAILWLAGVGSILAFTYVKYHGFLRHHGHIFILWFLAWWLSEARTTHPTLQSRLRRVVLVPLLVVQAYAGLYAHRMDMAHPFSRAGDVVAFLREEGLGALPFAGGLDHAIVPIGFAFGKGVYQVQSGRLSSHVSWDRKRENRFTLGGLMPRIEGFAERERSDVVVILTKPLPRPRHLEPLASFPGAIAERESFYVYLYRYRGRANPETEGAASRRPRGPALTAAAS